jgi:hypothetical protein
MRYHAPMTEVAFAPILLAGIVSAILGYIWFHPRVFGGVWMRLTGITPEQAERGKKRMWLMAIIGLLASMLIAYVMDYFGIAWGVYDVPSAINLGFWCWAGFVAPTMLGMVLWEQKPVRLYLINALYWLLSFIVMALVLFYASALFNADPASQNPGGYTSSQ